MRVPGNERAFTVSPARGIPQLVCIGAAAGQSQAFPVSARARLAAAGSWNWPARPRRRRCRALLYAAGVESPPPPQPPALPAHPHPRTSTHTLTCSPGAPPRCETLPCGFADMQCCSAADSGLQGAPAVPRPKKWRRPASRGWTQAARYAQSRPGPETCRASHGDAAAAARLLGPGARAAPGPARLPTAEPVSPAWVRFGREGVGGPRARPQGRSVRPHGRVGNCGEVALIHLVRADGCRSPQHGFCF